MDIATAYATWFFAYELIFFIYFLIINLGYLSLNVLGLMSIRPHALNQMHKLWPLNLDHTSPPISIIVPAYNEELTIVDSINSLLNVNYIKYEIIIVCDGSKDNTLGELKKHFQLVRSYDSFREELIHQPILETYHSLKDPRIRVVYKKNGGKADATNCGINISQYPLFCCIDADTLLDPECFNKMIKPFIFNNNTIAVGGIVRALNGIEVENGLVKEFRLPKTVIELSQVVEYLRSFFLGRMGWMATDSLLIISGAFGLFQKKAVINVGGYRKGSLGEDMDLILRLRRYYLKTGESYKIDFLPDAISYTQVPDDWATLGKQRRRWQRGLWECLVEHKELLFNRKGGYVAFLSYPFFILAEALGPVFELLGYIGVICLSLLGWINPYTALFFYVFSVLIGLIISFTSIIIEDFYYNNFSFKYLMYMTAIFFLEVCFYRYVSLYWRIQGTAQYFFQSKHDWGDMKRKKLNTV